MPLAAIAGIDDLQAPAAGEVNRWYGSSARTILARRRCAAISCWNCSAPPASTCRRGTNLPETPPGVFVWSCRRRDPEALQSPAPAASCRGVAARLRSRRRDAVGGAPSGGRRRHRAFPAPGRRGPCRTPFAIETAIAHGLYGPEEEALEPLSREAQAFLEMLTAERGASRTPRRPIAPISRTSRPSWRAASRAGDGRRRCAAGLSEIARLSRHDAAHGGAAAVGDAPVLPLPAGRAPARGRSVQHAGFAELGRPLPKVLSRAEVDRLIAAARAKGGDDGGRMATLLEILYGAGLRVSELVTLPLPR